MNLDTENWMWNLRDHIKTLRIKNVVLPGTHDSHTDTKKWAGNVICAFGKDMLRAQDKSPRQQLHDGIRYFDLRYQWQNGHPVIWHGMCHTKTPITQTMDMVKEFVTKHPKEIVILDLSHWSRMNVERHRTAVNDITNRLGDYMVHWGSNLDYSLKGSPDVTVQELWDAKKSVIAIYHSDGDYHPQDDAGVKNGKLFWREESIVSHWPQVNNDPDLQSVMEACLKCRSEISEDLKCKPPDAHDKIFVLQAQRTPAKNQGTSNLKNWAKQTNPKVIHWLQEWTTDGNSFISPQIARANLNIVIVDFYQIGGKDYLNPEKDKSFVETLVELNYNRAID